MIELVTKVGVTSVAHQLRNENKSFTLAVAYWGRRAIEHLGLDKVDINVRRDSRIICDLYSGACNPAEMRELMERLEYQVRQLPKLHAKVYKTTTSAMIGSSNASADGLGFEGDELRGHHECNVLIQDSELLVKLDTWLDDIWSKASKITEDDLARAEDLWERRRNDRGRLGSKRQNLFVEKLESDPEFFRDRKLEVWIRKAAEPSAESKRTTVEEKEKLGIPVDSYELDSYEDVRRPDGTMILDFEFDNQPESRELGFFGLWEVLADRPPRTGKENTLIVQKRSEFQTLRLRKGDDRWLKRKIAEFISRSKAKPDAYGHFEVSAYEFSKFVNANRTSNIK